MFFSKTVKKVEAQGVELRQELVQNSKSENSEEISLLLNNQINGTKKLVSRIKNNVVMVENLIEVVSQISSEIERQDAEIITVSDEMVQYTALAEEVKASIIQIEDLSAEISRNTQENGTKIVESSIDTINGIRSSVMDTSDIITSLKDNVGAIGSMVDMIKNISDQTNLLSLNARIEAARAGDAGKGFAVVASEINKLANESSEAAEKIEALSSQIHKKINVVIDASSESIECVDAGIESTNDIRGVLEDIIGSVASYDRIASEISGAIENQIESLTSVSESVVKLTGSSERILLESQSALMASSDVKNSLEWLDQSSALFEETIEHLNSRMNLAYKPTTLTTHISGEDFCFDPAKGVVIASWGVEKNCHCNLIGFGDKGDIYPLIAKAWHSKNDNLTWDITLRNDVYFHNGKKLTAEDVLYSFKRLLDPKEKNSHAWFLFDIDGAEDYHLGRATDIRGLSKINEYKISITLKSVNSGFLLNLAFPALAIINKEAHRQGNLVGCGPYVHGEHTEDMRVLNKYDRFFAGPAYVDKIVIYRNDVNIVENLEKGKYDFLELSDKKALDSVRGNGSYEMVECSLLSTEYSGFNFRRDTVFAKDADIRRAINYAFDNQKVINDYYEGKAKVAKGVFPPNMVDDSHLRGFECNLDKARRLLAQSSYKGETLKILNKGKEIGFVLKTLIEGLEKIQVKYEVVSVKSEAYFKSESIAQADMITLCWKADTGDQDNFLMPLFDASSFYSWGYDNKDVLNKMIYAKSLISPVKKEACYKEIQDIILEDCPWVFISHPQATLASKTYLENVGVNILGYPSYDNIMISDL
jgi:ABC-type transport system substrate-binding protein